MIYERQTLIDCQKTILTLNGTEFEIDSRKSVGRGGSCLVYQAFQKEYISMGAGEKKCLGRKVILKEFYPVAPGCGCWRREDGSLSLPETAPGVLLRKERFERSRELFVTLHNEDSLNLNMAEAQAFIHANGTVYMVVDYSSGVSLETYRQDPKNSLWDVLSAMRNLALVLSRLHGMGHLHLDLKPDNVLCHEQHLVRLIDTDSFVQIQELNGSSVLLSISDGFAAPEVLLCAGNRRDHRSWNRFRKYCRRADVYSFGAVLYHCLFDREPDWKTFQPEQLQPLLRTRYPDIPQKAVLLLQTLLESTLERSAVLRCPDMETVLAQLDKILPLVNPGQIRILENFSGNPYPVVGRDSQLAQLRTALARQSGRSSRIACITGLGGVGKSTLARLYGQCYGEDYDVIAEVSAASVSEAIRQIRIANWEPDWNLPEAERVAQAADKLAQLCAEHPMLLIVNNYDVSEDPGFSLWRELGCDILLTSRHDWSGSGIPTVPLACGDLSPEAAAEIFTHYYLADKEAAPQLLQQLEGDTAALDKLLQRLNHHPLGIKLMARYMAAVPGGELLPGQALKELEREGFSQDSPVAFQNDRDKGILEENVYGHLAFLFRSALRSGLLTPQERDALRYFLLTSPDRGISAGRFQKWTGLHSFLPEKLRRHGWLEYYPHQLDLLDMEPHRGVYLLPTVIREVLRKEPGMICTSNNRQPFPENNNCIPFLARAANADLSHLDSYERRYALCQEQQYLLSQMEGQQSELLAWLLHRTALNLINLNPRMLSDPAILHNLNKCDAMVKALGLKDHPLATECKITMGTVCYSYGMTKQAFVHFYSARTMEQQRPNPHPWRMAEVTLLLGRMHWDAGNLEAAISRAREALSFLDSEESRHVREKIYCFLALGKYLRVIGQWDEAERILLGAEDLFHRYCSDTDFSCIEIQTNLAALYLDRNDPDRALEHLNQVLELSKKLYGEQTLSYNVKVLAMLADAWARKGDRSKAIAYREELLSIYKINDSQDRSWAADYVYGALDSKTLDFARLYRLSAKPEQDTGDRMLAQYLLHLSLDYVTVDVNKTTQYLHAAVAAFNSLLGSYTVSLDEYENLYRLYYRQAGQLFRQSRIPEGFSVLEDWFVICRRLYGTGAETAMEALCLWMIYSRFHCRGKAEQYRQLFLTHSAGSRVRMLLQWIFCGRQFGRRYPKGKRIPGSSFHDRCHFGTFCRLLHTINQYRHHLLRVRAAKLRIKWRRLRFRAGRTLGKLFHGISK